MPTNFPKINPDTVEQKPISKPEVLGIPPTAGEKEKTAEQQPATREQHPPGEEKIPKTRKMFAGLKKMPAIQSAKDEETKKIEKIMEEDLEKIYETLSPIAKQEFKIKGEETAIKIRELLKSTHIKVKKIFQLIVDWLKFLPGINRFFLEQEAKIKTDKILMIKK